MNARLPLLLAVILLATAGCAGTVSAPATAPRPSPAPELPLPAPEATPKNVILILGDGMGVSHVTLARLLRGSEFQMGRMPVTGLVTTHSASSFVTDSAAAATALATGVKATNRTVGVDPEGNPHPTVLERAEERGMATGLVTTAAFWDASPVSFAAHHTSRYDAAILVNQMLAKDIELVAGGGAGEFGGAMPPLASVAAQTGYALVTAGVPLPRGGADRVLAVFPSETNDVDFAAAPLPELAAWAIDRLAGDGEGFFLFIEHEGTDSGSHSNADADVIASLRSLDAAVGEALAFAAEDGETLVLVTADHETGSLELGEGATASETTLRWATRGHTGEAVPLFAFGPGALRFTGMIDNTDVAKILFDLFAAP